MATAIAEPPHLAADLKTLCLSTIGAQWRLLAEQATRQRQAPADYLAQLVHLEVTGRRERRIQRRIQGRVGHGCAGSALAREADGRQDVGGRRGGGDERAGGAQGDEAEVLSTLLAERYERRSVMVTSNLVVQPVGPERPGAEPPVTGPLRNSVE